jgi:hypothetical protein
MFTPVRKVVKLLFLTFSFYSPLEGLEGEAKKDATPARFIGDSSALEAR